MEEFSLTGNVEAARRFDRKLAEMRRKVCEPSNLGGGMKTLQVFSDIKANTEELLRDARQLNAEVETQNKLSRDRISMVQDWINDLETEVNRIETIGRESGLVPLDCTLPNDTTSYASNS